jgi:hypothetical protein
MSYQRQELAKLTLDQLADVAAGPDAEPGSGAPIGIYRAEFARRQTLAFQQATEAQRRAAVAQEDGARAAIETARHTRRNASYLLASVIVLGFCAFATLAWTVVHSGH